MSEATTESELLASGPQNSRPQSEKNNNTVNVRVKFRNLTEKQMEHLFEAERQLNLAGVEFDTGAGPCGRDWELDWSLRGAEVHPSTRQP